MPTLLSRTATERVAVNVAPLAKGHEVADLQRALAFLDFEIADRELAEQRFGRTTTTALRAFQAQQGLPETGRIDDATADRLNETLGSRGFFPPTRRAFRDRRLLRVSPRDEDRFDDDDRQFIHERLNAELKDAMLSAFRQPSEALQTVVRNIELDYADLTDATLRDVFTDQVVPALLGQPQLEQEVERQADQGFLLSDETVAQRLMLDQDLRRHLAFTNEVRRARNTALGQIARLDAGQTEGIAELDLDTLGAESWDRLVTDNLLTARGRDDLRNAVELAKLTDDGFELIEALHREQRTAPRDLIPMNRSDWVTLLTRRNIPLPAGDSMEIYADLLNLNVDQTFRTPYLMHRLAERDHEEVLNRVADLQPIAARNERIFIDGRISENLDFTGVDQDEREKVEASLRELNRFANTYRHLGVTAILNDRNLNTRQKVRAIQGRQRLLQSFHRNNPDLDLEWANFFATGSRVGRAFQPRWTSIAEGDRPQVRQTMMALQRTQRLTGSFSETEALLAAGVDSSISILRLSEPELARRTGLPEAAVKRIQRKAESRAIVTGHALNLIEEVTTHAPAAPAVLKEGSIGPNVDIINVLRDIDGYSDLFGNQNYCRCKHCRSIFGPAAYFVDLMSFIDEHVSRPVFIEQDRDEHPLYLRNRRGDLWTLVLSCKNTDTKVPYLTIVNEVLERYLERELEEDDIYESLTEARLSFNQPFNLPFQALLLHLGYFRIPIADIYALFALPPIDLARGRLQASLEEIATIVTPNIDDSLVRYDVAADARGVPTVKIVRRSGYSREELGRLAELDFIRAGLHLTLVTESQSSDLIGFDETLAIRTGAIGQVLPSEHGFVRHFLDRLHRFRRLQRLVPWSSEELHLVLTSLIDPERFAEVATGNTIARTAALGRALDDALLIDVADLRRIQQALGLSVEELIAVFDEIPRSPAGPDQPSLFVRLFGEIESLRIEHPALGNTDPDNDVVLQDFGLLQGALRLPEAQVLELISAVLTPATIASAVFDHRQLSTLYRHAAWARALRLGPADLARVRGILDIPQAVTRPADRIAHVLEVLDFKDALDRTPLGIHDVVWLIGQEVPPPAVQRVGEADVEALLDHLRNDAQLFLTPESLVEIPDLRLEQAQALTARLAQEPLNWLSRADDVQERYRIAPEYRPNVDPSPVVAFFTDAGDTPEVATRKADDVRQHLDRHHPHAIFIAQLAERFNISQDYLGSLRPFLHMDPSAADFTALLFDWIDPEEDADTQPLLGLMRELERLLYLVQEKLALPAQSLAFIAANAELFGLALPLDATWESLRRLALYREPLSTVPEDAALLHEILTSWNGTAFPEGALPRVATLLKTDLTQLRSLLDNVALPADALDALAALRIALKRTSTLGLNGAALRQLTAPDYAGLDVANRLVEGAIRAKYEQESEWAKVVEPYVDRLNEIKRDALVDRILSRAFQLRFNDARELYQFFLLDVEMDGCARTSRVLEAISACQLYVHRCRMNLEQDVSGDVHVLPEAIPGDEWLWRKNYRVWEANRKVFLYPENWLDPDLRDDKTPNFRQAESELLQSTITPEAIEKIYRDYLREYAELARLVVVSTLYDENEDAYLFFARSREKPYQYYWRKFARNVEWQPWLKIELDIEPAIVSAHRHRGKLYLFWVRVLTNNDKDQERATATRIEDNQTVYLEYAYLESHGRWATPKRLAFHNIKVATMESDFSGSVENIGAAAINPNEAEDMERLSNFSKTTLEVADHYDHVYPFSRSDEHFIRLFHRYSVDRDIVSSRLDEFTNRMARITFGPLTWMYSPGFPFLWGDMLKIRPNWPNFLLFVDVALQGSELPGEVGYENSLIDTVATDDRIVTNIFSGTLEPQLRIVHGRLGDLVLTIDRQQLFIRYLGGDGYRQELESILEAVVAYASRKRDTLRLSTTLADDLGEILFNQGVDAFLSLDTQRLVESPIHGVEFQWLAELPPPMDTLSRGHLDFEGAQGPYYWELFFHLPFLIAHYLNASQKFENADHWYRRIFDPTASESPEPSNRTDRNWRFIKFRNRNVPRLREILTDDDAIERYKEDPFNPFAIARLRILAFQKAVVMKYIDNLLDWGDYLFGQDTVESINEATMLYIMAADILGERPAELGDCETTTESLLTYANILSHGGAGSEFLIELENLYIALAYINFDALQLFDGEVDDDGEIESSSFEVLRTRSVGLKPYATLKATVEQPTTVLPTGIPALSKIAAKASTDTAVQRTLAFCVPPNETLLGYWDRVADRLFKIRNCLNLQGVRRELALFQPPIDPGLLAKAKAAGLSLEDVLGLLTAEIPAYRFTYLVEKAKQFAGTVQSFGNALLSALEKMDTEELTLLRAVHEQDLLKAVRKSKEDGVAEAANNDAALVASKAFATARNAYYTNLLASTPDQPLLINKSEQESLDKQAKAKDDEGTASKLEQGASGIHSAPSIGFQFSPLILMLPFNPLGESPLRSHLDPLSITGSSGQIASVLTAIASKFRFDSSSKNIESSRAATRGGYERRKQEWAHQQNLAKLDEEQFNKQLLASAVRMAIAQKELDSHTLQMEQSAEAHEFYKNKFTSLGLYTHLASSLSRLHREAYNLAHDLAMKAQRAYQFETDDQTFFVAADNWQADKAGLLAGERLMLQLQQMENANLEQTRREYEITLPCSLAQIAPRALIDLRETGRCDFSIAEIWFDLFYPGQYKRRLKSVRLTMPCVTGPYTNVSARLTLIDSRIRAEPQLTSELIGVAHQRNTSVATSTGNNDAGCFELNFRDERYMPFEGAGVVSDWHLELPTVFRPFNYDTISDVILHISYVARDDGRFKDDVEADLPNRFEQLAAEGGLVRWFSMKREFGPALHRLLRPSPGATPAADITLDARYFPHFIRNREITLEQVTLVLKPVAGDAIGVDGLDVRLNNAPGTDWVSFPTAEGELRATTFALGNALDPAGTQWTISVDTGELTGVDDIWILVAYTI